MLTTGKLVTTYPPQNIGLSLVDALGDKPNTDGQVPTLCGLAGNETWLENPEDFLEVSMGKSSTIATFV